jgi:putative ABC transport system permease protein
VTKVPVLGVWADGDFGGRDVWVPMPLFTKMFGPQPPNALLLTPVRSMSTDQLAQRIGAAHLDPFLTVQPPAELSRNSIRDALSFAQPFWELQRGMMLVTFIAVLFTLLLVAVQRRRELGLVVAVGMSPRDMARMVVTEALAVAAVGSIAGALLGLAMVVGFRYVLFVFLPFRFPLAFVASAPFVYGAITTVLLVVAAAFPAWRNSRLQVVEAVRYE